MGPDFQHQRESRARINARHRQLLKQRGDGLPLDVTVAAYVATHYPLPTEENVFNCVQCGRPKAHSRINGMFCLVCDVH